MNFRVILHHASNLSKSLNIHLQMKGGGSFLSAYTFGQFVVCLCSCVQAKTLNQQAVDAHTLHKVCLIPYSVSLPLPNIRKKLYGSLGEKVKILVWVVIFNKITLDAHT